MKTTQLISLAALTVSLNALKILAEGTIAGRFTSPNTASFTGMATTDYETCASYCTTKYAWIYYGNYCLCSDTYGTYSSRSPYNPDTCISNYRAASYVKSTTFDFANCATPGSVYFDGEENTEYTTATDIIDCFGQCKTSRYAALAYDNIQSSYVCANGDELSSQISESCTTASTLVYTHPAGAAVSGLARRNAREALRRSRQAALVQTCPKGMTACVIPGLEGTDAWECVDTHKDLESCGGCLHGTYKNSTTAIGRSCQDQEGVSLGGTTCQAGKCVKYGCASGYRLVDGDCIAV
ncbi:hypothetical protein I203_101768 [Kwoniella mangroviensis CBS 8507]|uniref:uncharacterized protein n=1 Tax=Kwoniella mangroviensis CBS 8507 TaxID=1296122 RepID=UPI00080CE09D|nr:uncharacterized protein I203_07336 [Kwoniella mangroviensis CBS 8507]OCF63638.1 hypothetical protein I203_07336 [Kwoniella mangroviensis CBS 8507]